MSYSKLKPELLDAAADIHQFFAGRQISKLMYLVWQSRQDIRSAFDLQTESGQREFFAWYDVAIEREYSHVESGTDSLSDVELEESAISGVVNSKSGRSTYITLLYFEGRLSSAFRWMPASWRKLGKRVWLQLMVWFMRFPANRIGNEAIKSNQFCNVPASSRAPRGTPGMNLIGHAFAELGMGEHVRMTAASLVTTAVPFGVINYDVGVPSRKQAKLEYGGLISDNKFQTNIFHINADQLLNAYIHYGKSFFSNKYNILYPFWELSKWPDAWVDVLDIVDEVWAPTQFIKEAIESATRVPVVHMPVAVVLPSTIGRTRQYFKLPEDKFLFLFTFDSFSFIERKNPFAIVQAFARAFPRGTESVGLVIKSMNAVTENARWQELLSLAGGDSRVHVINQTMSRSDVVDLFAVTDCFVSLHRAEGFGRGPAEAMCLGKPTIVTNYSGNLEFSKSNNSCLVDYKLISIKENEYVMAHGQVWADPDVDHAAWYMKKLATDSYYARSIGMAAKATMLKDFNSVSIGRGYSSRLQALYK